MDNETVSSEESCFLKRTSELGFKLYQILFLSLYNRKEVISKKSPFQLWTINNFNPRKLMGNKEETNHILNLGVKKKALESNSVSFSTSIGYSNGSCLSCSEDYMRKYMYSPWHGTWHIVSVQKMFTIKTVLSISPIAMNISIFLPKK